MISAEIVLDSKNEFGNRITTFKLTFPRIVLAEFNTHRMISRNSASSRAIPFETMLKRVKENPFMPIKWLTEHKGMQGFDYYEPHTKESIACQDAWNHAKETAIKSALLLNGLEVSKQFVNRLLEPFMWHTIIATATEWENFFALRAHPMAEIHIQDLAFKMLDEYNKSKPQELKAGEWHIPFKELINEREVIDWTIENNPELACYDYSQKTLAKISAGICAGISYGRIKDKFDFIDMLDLYESLVERPYEGRRGIRTINDPIHASPCEHQAQAMRKEQITYCGSGNFKGFIQYRKILSNENAKDERVVKI